MPITLMLMSLDFESACPPSTKDFGKDEVTLGRAAQNDVVLDLPEISDRHAKLCLRPDSITGEPLLYVTDLGSLNGTFIENRPIQALREVPLARNQRIQIGRYLIKPLLSNKSLAANHNGVSSEEKPTYQEAHGDDLPGEYTNGIGKHEHESEESAQAPSSDTLSTGTDLAGMALHSVDSERLQVVEETRAVQHEPEEEIAKGMKECEPVTKQARMPEKEVLKSSRGDDLMYSNITGTVIDSALTDLDFVARQLFPIRGMVTHRGRPLADVTIDGGILGKTTTDANGSFLFTDIPEDTSYSFTATKKDFRFMGEISGMVEGEDVSVNFEAIQLFTVSGKILHRGKPLAEVDIDGGVLGKTQTGPDGSYRFSDVPENTKFSLTASRRGFIFSHQVGKVG